ncbi:hypothetical protein OH77DRAFT_1522050 [Trametes cingulata]|nr:hypothetical protein OH77DRAFT_1522050 [Trametes cingulata]
MFFKLNPYIPQLLVTVVRIVFAAPLTQRPAIGQDVAVVRASCLSIDALTEDQTIESERKAALAELDLPRGVHPEEAINRLTREDVLTHWKPAQKIVVPHREDVGLHGGLFYPELSMAALHRDGTFILAHERNTNRMVGSRENWGDLTADNVEKMSLGYRPIDEHGRFASTLYATDQRIPTLRRFVDESLLCVPGANALLDTRDNEDPVEAVMTLINRRDLEGRIGIQLYNLGFDDATAFVREIEKRSPPERWKSRILIIPVLRPDGMHKIAGIDADDPNYHKLERAGFNWLDSWKRAGLLVPGYGLPVQGGYKLVDGWTHRVNRALFRQQFLREPTALEEADLVKDHLLDVMIRQRKGCEPERFVIVTSSAPTTNFKDQLFRVKDWMYMEAAKAGAAFENGGDICITDQAFREISYNAWISVGQTPPSKLRDPMYPAFSQDNFCEALAHRLPDADTQASSDATCLYRN